MKDLEYYKTADKVFWVVNRDIKDLFKANEIIPAIYVERCPDGKQKIIQFDDEIKDDRFRYTTWRKLIGDTHNIYVDVLLIKGDHLYTLNGDRIEFDQLGRSSINVDKSILAKFSLK